MKRKVCLSGGGGVCVCARARWTVYTLCVLIWGNVISGLRWRLETQLQRSCTCGPLLCSHTRLPSAPAHNPCCFLHVRLLFSPERQELKKKFPFDCIVSLVFSRGDFFLFQSVLNGILFNLLKKFSMAKLRRPQSWRTVGRWWCSYSPPCHFSALGNQQVWRSLWSGAHCGTPGFG